MRIPFQMVLPEDLCGLAHVFHQAGKQLYVVGGAVRDAVLGKTPKDFDVATDATPDEVIELLRPILAWRVLEVGKAFGVVRARLDGGDYEYEIATFRQDIGEGRRPDSVIFTTIEEDVKRRDLTINALFYDINKAEIVDLVGGFDDLNDHIIRTVGLPEDRFREDRLRVLRAIRFASKLGFTLESRTLESIEKDNNLDGVSFERVRDEMVKAIQSAKKPRRLITLLDQLKMWPRVLPGLAVTPVPDTLVSSSSVETCNVAVALAILLDLNAPEHVAKRLNQLKYSAAEVAQVTFLLRFRDITPFNAYRLWRSYGTSHLMSEDLIEYARERGLPESRMLNTFLNYSPITTGDQLLAEGFTGSALGNELARRETVRFCELHGEH